MSEIPKIIRFRRQTKSEPPSNTSTTPNTSTSQPSDESVEETHELESFISVNTLKLFSQEDKADFIRLAEMLDKSYQQFLTT
ncbi:hypothetical protein K7432_007390 [Basidiobolus ranarum]|uniref:Uncharacterized protein n=1 Tax=Basidiobolus ranarum TaxID=34480 RepID=A0ABR2WTI1_9FUNG